MLPEGYEFPTGFLVFLALWLVLPPVLMSIGLWLIKPGKPEQFGLAPRRRKSIASAFLTALRKTLHYTSRASRSEFWWYFLVAFVLINSIAGLLLGKHEALAWIFEAVTALPGLAVGARRLHDIGRSGWWQLCLLTVSGGLVLLALWALPSSKPEDASIEQVFE